MIRLRRHENATRQHPKVVEEYSLEIQDRKQTVQSDVAQLTVNKSSTATNLPSHQNILRSRSRRQRLKSFIAEQIYVLVHTLVQLLFSLYLWLRRSYHAVVYRLLDLRHYHYRNPTYIENDAKRQDKLPGHLSVIFELQEGSRHSTKQLVKNASEIAAWTAAAGIPILSIYESTGEFYLHFGLCDKCSELIENQGHLKHNLSNTFSRIQYTLRDYFGPNSPSLTLCAPNFSPFTSPGHPLKPNATPLTVILLSLEDGRDTLVDLTRTLAAMAQRDKISPDDITADIVDAEVAESVAPEPDLLIVSGSRVKLSGYPPWQLRLTEI